MKRTNWRLKRYSKLRTNAANGSATANARLRRIVSLKFTRGWSLSTISKRTGLAEVDVRAMLRSGADMRPRLVRARNGRPPQEVVDRRNQAQGYVEELRERATTAERALCRLLTEARISYVFQSLVFDEATQRVFIADFRIRRPNPQQKLYVEIDGGYHAQRTAYDAKRTEWIENYRNGIVLRFTNEEVLTNGAAVISEIAKHQPAYKKQRA